ncbi:DNA polymerase [Corynebacterium amycolatum]|uniref:DNA polymerase n=1 Tax=Corynebacterium amycolatum TaxID=43765 RepID=UPI00234CC145|nr:DNA polymerase [Corynebacterium amycolatum]MDC7116133.1 DNA polymerase [Corynebacterium amycolatum]
MRTISIDIETYSPEPLASAGVYKYAEHPDFDILLLAYSIDDQPVQVIDLAQGEAIPTHILAALTDCTITKYAYNANFERVCLTHYLRKRNHLHPDAYLDPHGWHCTMVWASALGLPRSLKDVGTALGLEQQKMREGQALIRLFCTPQKPRGKQAELFDTTRTSPRDQPEKWATFIEYCRRDVEVETRIRHKLDQFPLPDWVWGQYWYDQRINDRGITVDLTLAKAAIDADTNHRSTCMERACRITGLDNPNSPTQLLGWLNNHGCGIESLAKAHVTDALTTATGQVKTVLELRQELSRSSVKKYQAMLDATCTDGRAHGLLQFYGAGRTGRWAGRLIQVQNLPRNYLPDLDTARALIRDGNADTAEMLYDSLPDTLSQLIRTAFIPTPGERFIVADYSAIEARVLAWLAGQDDTLQAFRDGKDLYCATATAMFGVPVEKHGPNAELRQKGKIAVLACGYQGGVGAIRTMGGERMGMTDTEMKNTVDAWRNANTNIVTYWWDIDTAAKNTIKTGQPQQVRNITLHMDAGILFIILPSGRKLAYPGAGIGTNRFGGESIIFYGPGLGGKFARQETYGGKLVENITQAVARDLLAHAIGLIENAGHHIVMHIHDEVVIEAPPATTITEICDLMARNPTWAPDIPLTADGYECTSYRKD